MTSDRLLLWVVFNIFVLGVLAVDLGVFHQKALEFFTGYLIEYSLSVDNIFVFIIIFSYFAVPSAHQYRVLFWGILGALVMRGAFIATGALLLEKFHWVIYVFGAFLVFTGSKMLIKEETTLRPEDNPVIKLLARL